MLSRRAFLKKVLLGLVAFVPTARALMMWKEGVPRHTPLQSAQEKSALPPPPPAPVPVEHVIEPFQAGQIVDLRPGQLILQTPDRGMVTLYLLPETDIWEGRWVKDIPMRAGDQVVAWGHRRSDGALEVTKLWVNIVNLIGPIADLQKEGNNLRLRIRDRRQGWQRVLITPQTFIALPGRPRMTFADNPVDLKAGQFLQIIGRELEDGLVLATDVLID